MKLRMIAIFFLTIFFATRTFASQNAVSWYCQRNKEHLQPKIAHGLEFCENYDLYWCDKSNSDINEKDKVIYLTFDAGYENGNVDKIVDILKSEDVTGAFFILDNLIYKNEDLVRKMINNGNIVANHTAKHKDMSKIKNKEEFKKELVALENLYKETFGEEMKKYYRPPEGKISEDNLKWLNELGYKTILWSFAYADWDNNNQPTKDSAKRKILENIHNGEVVLLHPTSSTNCEILAEIIKELKSEGFRFGTLDELCAK